MNVLEAYSTIFKDYPDVVSVKQVSKMIGVGEKTCYRLIQSKKLKCIQVGRKCIVPKIFVFEYL